MLRSVLFLIAMGLSREGMIIDETADSFVGVCNIPKRSTLSDDLDKFIDRSVLSSTSWNGRDGNFP